MISKIEFKADDKVLDLGCGIGVVGIVASKSNCQGVVMSDISDEALSLSEKNVLLNKANNIKIIKSDGLNNIKDTDFTLIITNPPYHVDFSVPKQFIEMGYKRLVTGGKMFMVTKRKTWYENKLTSVFGGVKVFEIDGYFVFMAEKRNNIIKRLDNKPKSNLSKKLEHKLEKSNFKRKRYNAK